MFWLKQLELDSDINIFKHLKKMHWIRCTSLKSADNHAAKFLMQAAD